MDYFDRFEKLIDIIAPYQEYRWRGWTIVEIDGGDWDVVNEFGYCVATLPTAEMAAAWCVAQVGPEVS
jgi:hypothetical protein